METRAKFKSDPKTSGFRTFGIHFTKQLKDEEIGECIFCGKSGHFYVNVKTLAWICHRCGKSGSIRDFFREVYHHYLKLTTDDDLRLLTKEKGIPLPTLREWKVASTPEKEGTKEVKEKKFFLPVYAEKVKEVIDLRWWSLKTKKERATGGGITGILNFPQLLEEGSQLQPVYLCEGMFDCLALDWLLRRTNNEGIVLAVPGANVFKDDWSFFFENRDVIICYDNDEAGYGTFDKETNKATGSFKVRERIKDVVNSLSFIVWPDNYKEGYDVRDFTTTRKSNPTRCFASFSALISSTHKFATENSRVGNYHGKEPGNISKNSTPITISRIIDKAREVYELDSDFINGIKVSLATVIAARFTGRNPPWLLLVGAPSYGKTAILEMLEGSRKVLWESTLSSKSLVSGFNLSGGQDFSILARINNKCLVLKDLTEILSIRPQERDEIFGILRGGFDGRVKRPFGSGTRNYICNFTMLAGVTHEIKAYSMATLGERFLRYILTGRGINVETVQEKALNSQYSIDDRTKELKELVRNFLEKDFTFNSDFLPQWWRERIHPLARLVAHLRTPVTRFEKGLKYGQVIYKPIEEAGTRLAAQLEKVAIALCQVEGKEKVDEEIYEVIKKIARDTIESYSVDIMSNIIKSPGINRLQIMERLGIKEVSSYIEDLEILKLVTKNGKDPAVYSPSGKILELWRRAHV